MQAHESFPVPVWGLLFVVVLPVCLGAVLLIAYLIDRAWFRGLLTALLFFGGLAVGGLLLICILAVPFTSVSLSRRVEPPTETVTYRNSPSHGEHFGHEHDAHAPAHERIEHAPPFGVAVRVEQRDGAPTVASRPSVSRPTESAPNVQRPTESAAVAPRPTPAQDWNAPADSAAPQPEWVAAPHFKSKLASDAADAEADLQAQVGKHLKEKYAPDQPADFAFASDSVRRAIAEVWWETVPSPRLEQDMLRLHGRVSVDSRLAGDLAGAVRAQVSRERSRQFLYWSLGGAAGLCLLLPTSRLLRGNRRPTWPPEPVAA